MPVRSRLIESPFRLTATGEVSRPPCCGSLDHRTGVTTPPVMSSSLAVGRNASSMTSNVEARTSNCTYLPRTVITEPDGVTDVLTLLPDCPSTRNPPPSQADELAACTGAAGTVIASAASSTAGPTVRDCLRSRAVAYLWVRVPPTSRGRRGPSACTWCIGGGTRRYDSVHVVGQRWTGLVSRPT